MEIKRVTVIGANGNMGINISGIFASFGNAKVYMVARDLKKAEAAKEMAALSVKAASVKSNLFAADYSMLNECVAKSDLIFEIVSENFEIKRQIAEMVAKAMRSDAISCTGTSGLSVTALAERYPGHLRSRFFGVHIFNPPYSLTLCELTPTKYSDSSLCNKLNEYLRNILCRTVVLVKDTPAFLANRIGFQFINEVMQYAEKYKDFGGIDYMDAVLGLYSGRSMTPMETADYVGLDIHKAIVDNIYDNTNDYAHETFTMPDFAVTLITEGRIGKKAGGGLYKFEMNDDGLRQKKVYDIASGTYRYPVNYQFPFAAKMISNLRVGDYESAFRILIASHSVEAELQTQFLLKYVVYSLVTAEDVGYDIHSADHVMATGFNWCPPLAVADALNTVTDFKQLVRERLNLNMTSGIDLERVLASIVPSKYDYRPFFKAKI